MQVLTAQHDAQAQPLHTLLCSEYQSLCAQPCSIMRQGYYDFLSNWRWRSPYIPASTMEVPIPLRCFILGITAVLLATACSSGADASPADEYAHLLSFDTSRVRLVSASDTTSVAVELARTPDQHTMGLMERRALAQDSGMLFLYPDVQPESSAFWMFRTRLPLDIAFIDSAGTIRSIRTMVPCTSLLAAGCPEYPAGARYMSALEVNAGFFARHRIGVGSRLLLDDTGRKARASRPPT